jgi:hypothetical protein
MLRPFEFDGAMAKQIAQHPNTETITDILRGEKFTSGIMPHSSRDSATSSEPQCINDLNNFHGYFQGGVYRGAGLFELSSAAKSQSHLRTLLQVLARDMSQGHVDLIASLAGYSYRYLSESPQELWRSVDAATRAVTRSEPKEFGELFREMQQSIYRLQVQLDFIDELKNSGEAVTAPLHDPSLPDPSSLRAQMRRMQVYWDKKVEPQVMAIYRSLVAEGSAQKDFWT